VYNPKPGGDDTDREVRAAFDEQVVRGEVQGALDIHAQLIRKQARQKR